MQTSKMPIGVTKLKRRYHKLQIICLALLAFSVGSAIGGMNRKFKERKTYVQGFSDGLDTSLAISKRIWKRDDDYLNKLSDSITTRSVEHFVNHSEIK